MPQVKDLIQGTPQWHSWRKGKLSASKSAIIMGLSPYQTPFELFEEELGLKDPKPSSPHMQRGLDVEDEARQWLWETLRIEFKPTCWEHVNPLYISSLDGMSLNNRHIVEIKNNNKEYHEMARSGNIVPMHLCQMQHHMFVTELEECFYLSWRNDDPILVIVKRDQEFINQMIAKEFEFKQMLENLTSPPLTDRDYVDMTFNADLEMWADQYNESYRIWKLHESRCRDMKEVIKVITKNQNVKGNGFKITKYPSRAIIDYDRLIAENCPNVDLKSYTKPATYAYRITMES